MMDGRPAVKLFSVDTSLVGCLLSFTASQILDINHYKQLPERIKRHSLHKIIKSRSGFLFTHRKYVKDTEMKMGVGGKLKNN